MLLIGQLKTDLRIMSLMVCHLCILDHQRPQPFSKHEVRSDNKMSENGLLMGKMTYKQKNQIFYSAKLVSFFHIFSYLSGVLAIRSHLPERSTLQCSHVRVQLSMPEIEDYKA